jgi:hypothetical protein
MQKTILLVCIATILFAQTANAQAPVSNYKLSDFKYRTDGYKLLRLNGSFSSRVINSNDVTAVSKSLGIGSNCEVEFAKSVSQEAKQRFLFASAAIYPPSINSTKTSVTTKMNSYFAGLNVTDFHRIYKGNYFFEFGGNFRGSLNSQKIKVNDSTTRSYKLNYLDVGLNIGVGTGRLENVTDAQTALFILNDLKEIGSIKSYDAQTADKLAKFITQVRNGRVFDLRRRTKQQIKEIAKFLKDNGIIKTAEADEVGIINDNLYFSFNNDLTLRMHNQHSPEGTNSSQYSFYRPNFFASIPELPYRYFETGGDKTDYPDYLTEFAVQNLVPDAEQTQRMSGTKIYLRARGINSLRKFETTKNKALGIVAQVGIEKHRPINLHWQEGISVNLLYSNIKNGTRTFVRYFNDNLVNSIEARNDAIAKSNSIQLNGRYFKGYYPNGRTSIEGLFNFDIYKSTKYSGFAFNLAPQINGTYFINHNTLIRGGASFNFFNTRISTNNPASTFKLRTFNAFIDISILHTFF